MRTLALSLLLALSLSSQQSVQVYTASAFGAKGDFSTDDAGAVQKAITYACAPGNRGPSMITLSNNRIGSALDFSACRTNNVYPTVNILGRISSAVAIIWPQGVAINGAGMPGVQFQKSPVGQIYCDAGANHPTYGAGCLFLGNLPSASNISVQNIAVFPAAGAGIYITPFTPLVNMQNVGGLAANVAGSIPLVIDGSFWISCTDCAFDARDPGYPAAVRITNSTAGQDFSGLITFKRTIIGTYGYQVDSQVATNGLGNITWEDSDYEQCRNAFLNIDSTNGFTSGIKILRTTVADPITPSPLIHLIAHAEKVSGVYVDASRLLPGTVTAIADAPLDGLAVDFARPTLNLKQNQINMSSVANGMVDADWVSNGATPLFGTPFASISAQQNPALWTPDAGTVTTGVSDPYIGANAGTFASPGGCGQINLIGAVQPSVGDWVIAGVWYESSSTFPAGVGGCSGAPADLNMTGTGTFTWSNGDHLVRVINDAALHNGPGVWTRVTVAAKVIAAGTGTYQFLLQADSTHSFSFYKPWMVVIPSGTKTDNEVTRYATYLAGYPSGLSAPTGPRLSMYNETSLGWGTDTYMTRSAAGEVSVPGVRSAYKSSDGTAGLTGSTCTAWKNGLCVAP